MISISINSLSIVLFVSVLLFILFTDDPSEPLLQRVAGIGSEGVESESEGGGGRLAQYYIKVLRLFEQVPAPSLVIAVADEATKRVSREDPNCVSGCVSVPGGPELCKWLCVSAGRTRTV